MTDRRGLRFSGVTVLVGCLLLAGCGDDRATRVDEQPGASGLTAPGTRLAQGEVATVPLGDGAGVVDLTVTGVDQGSVGDLDGISGLTGTPYYLRLEATAVSGDADQFFAEQHVVAWAGDERLGVVQAPVSIGSCTRAYFRLDAPAGASITPCLTVLAPPGSPAVDRVSFFDHDDYTIGDNGDDDDVEWR